MNRFAILRHQKIKSGRHLVATGLHNGRGVFTANADSEAEPVRVLVGSNAPHRDVWADLKECGIGRVRKNGVVAVEVLLTASPDWWESKGWKAGVKPTGELKQLVDDWIDANVEYLKERFGDRLRSVIAHLDEKTPHLQALAVPRELKADKREAHGLKKWRLNSAIDVGSPGRLKQLHTEYAKKMERFGLVRGEDRGTGERAKSGDTHKPLSEHQHDQAEITRKQEEALQGLRDMSTKQTALKAETEQDRLAAMKDRSVAAAERKAAESSRSEAREAAERADQDREAAKSSLIEADSLNRAAKIQKNTQVKEGVRLAARKLELDRRDTALEAEGTRLAAIAAELNTLLEPIRLVAKQFAEAVGIKRQSLEKPNRAAKEVLESKEIEDLERLMSQLDSGNQR